MWPVACGRLRNVGDDASHRRRADLPRGIQHPQLRIPKIMTFGAFSCSRSDTSPCSCSMVPNHAVGTRSAATYPSVPTAPSPGDGNDTRGRLARHSYAEARSCRRSFENARPHGKAFHGGWMGAERSAPVSALFSGTLAGGLYQTGCSATVMDQLAKRAEARTSWTTNG
jgi:hypothetical protein